MKGRRPTFLTPTLVALVALVAQAAQVPAAGEARMFAAVEDDRIQSWQLSMP